MSSQQATKAWARTQLLALAAGLLPEGPEIIEARALGANDVTLATLYPPAKPLTWIRALDDFLIGGELADIDLDAPGAVLAGYLAIGATASVLRRVGPAEPTTDTLVQDAYVHISDSRSGVVNPTDAMVVIINLLRGLATPSSGLLTGEVDDLTRFTELVDTVIKIVSTPQRIAARTSLHAVS